MGKDQVPGVSLEAPETVFPPNTTLFPLGEPQTPKTSAVSGKEADTSERSQSSP